MLSDARPSTGTTVNGFEVLDASENLDDVRARGKLAGMLSERLRQQRSSGSLSEHDALFRHIIEAVGHEHRYFSNNDFAPF